MRLINDEADAAREYYGEPKPRPERTPFEVEIDRQDFGPRWCPGWNHAICTARITGPLYFCDACTKDADEFRARLREELKR